MKKFVLEFILKFQTSIRIIELFELSFYLMTLFLIDLELQLKQDLEKAFQVDLYNQDYPFLFVCV